MKLEFEINDNASTASAGIFKEKKTISLFKKSLYNWRIQLGRLPHWLVAVLCKQGFTHF